MLTSIRFAKKILMGVLLAGCFCSANAHATETVLHSCSTSYSYGAYPVGQLTAYQGKFYGMTSYGLHGDGNVYTMTASGAINVIHEFGGSDGATPNAGLVFKGSAFYGTTIGGGSSNAGVLFKLASSGGITILHAFAGGSDGANPYSALLPSSDGNFYGTTVNGGASNQGTVFSYNPKTGAYKVLHAFNNTNDTVYNPVAGLAESGSLLYGTTENATNFYGGIYRLKKDGSHFSFVHGFTGSDPAGYTPGSDLIAANDGNLYGTCSSGGINNYGTVYKIVPGSTDTIKPLWAFDGFTGAFPEPATASTQNRLLQASDGNLYGVTQLGGAYGYGTAFKLTLAGACLPLCNFNIDDTNGTANPLMQSGSSFYLTSCNGGSTTVMGDGNLGYGAAFSLSSSGALAAIQSFYEQDAWYPYCEGGLVQVGSGKTASYYGVLYSGGIFEDGAIFKIDSEGNFSIVHHLDNYLNEGSGPWAGLTLGSDGKTLFGSTTAGGLYTYGTLFSVTTSGVFTVIHQFQSKEGYGPAGRLVAGVGSDKNLYGACYNGGAKPTPAGTIFAVSPTGSTFQVIHYFSNNGLNGVNPQCTLMPDGSGNLYGTTVSGGANNLGTIFKVSTTGATFSDLFDFYYDSVNSVYPYGYSPLSGTLVLHEGILYGTTQSGGAYGDGAIWAYNTGTGKISAFHSFNNSIGEGNTPVGGVTYDIKNGFFYGTCYTGGTQGAGTIWKVKASTANLTVLYTFSGDPDGANPYGSVLLGADGDLYLTTLYGGAYNVGAIVKQTP